MRKRIQGNEKWNEQRGEKKERRAKIEKKKR